MIRIFSIQILRYQYTDKLPADKFDKFVPRIPSATLGTTRYNYLTKLPSFQTATLPILSDLQLLCQISYFLRYNTYGEIK